MAIKPGWLSKYGGTKRLAERLIDQATIDEVLRRFRERYPKMHGHLYCGGKLIGEITSPVTYTPAPPNVQYIGPLEGREITIEMQFSPLDPKVKAELDAILEKANESASESST